MISLIFAMDKNNLIGKGNSLPWHYSEDLKYFKNTTKGHKVLMGDNTYYSIGKALPNRINYVATLDKNFNASDVIIINDLFKFLEDNKDTEEEIFVIGGRMIYSLSLKYAKKLYITHIDNTHEGDIYFKDIDFNDFKLISSNQVDVLNFCIYERK